MLFKAIFIGYLFGIRSERQLVREIEVNVAYLWFLRLKLTDPVFDASTLSQNRRRRYKDTSVAQDIFDGIVEPAISHGLVDGAVLYTDSTHLKANANKSRWDDLDEAITLDRRIHGKKPLKEKVRHPVEKKSKISRTDPDSGYMVRDGKTKGFFCLDHRAVDGKMGIITDTHTTPANVHDSIPYLERLDRQRERFDLDVRSVGRDAGYATAGIARGLEERDIKGVTGYRRPPHRKGYLYKRQYVCEPEVDGYRYPDRQVLLYATTDRDGYRHYKSDPTKCRTCPLLASCTSNAKYQKTVTRHVWQDARERTYVKRTYVNRLTDWGKDIYKRREETVERSFAAAAQNIKKIALTMALVSSNVG